MTAWPRPRAYLRPMKALLFAVGLLISSFAFAQETPPYSTSFEGAVGTLNTNFPLGWTWEDLNTVALSNQGWQIIKNSPNAQNARTDSTAAHMFSHSSQTNDDWLYTPGVQCEANTPYEMRFWYSRAASFPSTEKLALHVGTTAGYMDMGTAIWQNMNITSGTYQQATATWIAPADGVYYFGFHYFSDDFQFILLLDDVSIEALPVGISERSRDEDLMWVSDEQLNIQGSFNGPADLSVVDATGRAVLAKRLNGPVEQVDLSGVPNGTYLVGLRTSSGRSSAKRIVLLR